MPGTKLGFKFGGTTPNNSSDLGETFVRRDYFERKSLTVVRAQNQTPFGTYEPGASYPSTYKVNGADVGLGLSTANYGTITNTTINTDGDWIDVKSIQQVGAAVKRDGTLWVWGGNRDYSLGLGDTTNRNAPTQSGSATDWKRVFQGWTFTYQENAGSGYGDGSGVFIMAQKQDGTLWSWGRGLYPGSTVLSSILTTPTQVNSDTDWVDVYYSPSSGGFALKSNGALYGWGAQTNGWLGNGQANNSAINMTRIGTSTWRSIPKFMSYTNGTIALNTDGNLYWWGYTVPGWYWGTGESSTQTTPVVASLGNIPSNATKAFGSARNVVVLDSAGGCYAWKWNTYDAANRRLRKITDIAIKDVVFSGNEYSVYLLSWEGDVYQIDNAGYSYDQAYLTMISDGVRKYSTLTTGLSCIFGVSY